MMYGICFESLASYQWQCESASSLFVCSSLPPYRLHDQSPHADQLRDLFHYNSSYPLRVCSYCQSFDHDMHSCPYYNVFDEFYVRLNAMAETMNEQHKHFVSEISECGLLQETGPALLFLDS